MYAARARAAIVRGDNGAGTWERALDGEVTEEGTYCIAVQGVQNADAARERWRAVLPALDRIAGAWDTAGRSSEEGAG